VENNIENIAMVRIPESDLLSLVASLLKDTVLFPEKIEDAKAFLHNLQPANQ
jgi:hypothetical protein